ncbi:unnamed protein product [Agarophyton chilense]|eukprot:gb/GEZJ01002909.1/.p1 GENE.gb/GEZJ01002909.1/~~gb/GEZJ01002909.1/.p1  ORF type:complete len:399 (-),score=52.55 gb/GEZJ01002909.1/:50-1246(-)
MKKTTFVMAAALGASATSARVPSAGVSVDERPAGVAKVAAPRRLVVLVHGLQGAVEDFSYVLHTLHGRDAVASGEVLVHASDVNTDKTHDGVDLGGLRLAEEVRDVVGRHRSLQAISLVGFSLGGLYVRYAAARLWRAADNSVAGLRAEHLVLVASPNLGVRHFGLYRFLHGVLPLTDSFLFRTAKQLFLRDAHCLLERMTRDDCIAPVGGVHGCFVSALCAFDTRTLYANVRNDFMVNYGTAALDADVKQLDGAPAALQRVSEQRNARRIDSRSDARGCHIRFELRYPLTPLPPLARGPPPQGGAMDDALLQDGDAVERVMARRLRAVGWRVVAVDFPMPAPLAHNRIVAMSRNGVHSWFNAAGRRVVHHLADALCAARQPDEAPLFRAVPPDHPHH